MKKTGHNYSIAVVLPAYNEAQTVAATIRGFHAELPQAQLWIIDNNSTDETGKIASETILSLGVRGGVIEESWQGKGNALRRAFHEVEADIYVISDADQTYPPEQVHLLLEPVIDGRADMVVGDRRSMGRYREENKRPLHNFGNWLVQEMVNKLFNANLLDIMSGYRVLNRLFVKTYPILVSGFEIETDMAIHALDKRMRIIEIPINYRDRPVGSFSKLNTIRDGLRVINTITTVLRYYRPLVFFGVASLFTSLLGLVAALPVFNDWIRERYVYHVPLAILATGLEIVAIVLAAIGLILDSITHQDKRRFELELLNRTDHQR
jgi:glycosyltransferase involved in cell wall biosynthesis